MRELRVAAPITNYSYGRGDDNAATDAITTPFRLPDAPKSGYLVVRQGRTGCSNGKCGSRSALASGKSGLEEAAMNLSGLKGKAQKDDKACGAMVTNAALFMHRLINPMPKNESLDTNNIWSKIQFNPVEAFFLGVSQTESHPFKIVSVLQDFGLTCTIVVDTLLYEKSKNLHHRLRQSGNGFEASLANPPCTVVKGARWKDSISLKNNDIYLLVVTIINSQNSTCSGYTHWIMASASGSKVVDVYDPAHNGAVIGFAVDRFKSKNLEGDIFKVGQTYRFTGLAIQVEYAFKKKK